MSTTPASNGSPPPNGHGPGRTLEKLLVDSREAAEMISVSRATWARMVSAGEVMGIDVVDHLVLADQRYYSLLESGGIAAAGVRWSP